MPSQSVTKPGLGSGGRAAMWIVGAVALVVIVLLLALTALPDPDGRDPLAGPGTTGANGSPFGGNDQGDDGAGGDSGGGLFGPGGGGEVRFQPDSIDVDEQSAWVSDFACGLVVHIDKATGEVAGIVDLGGSASGVTVESGSVWIGNRIDTRIARLDPATA